MPGGVNSLTICYEEFDQYVQSFLSDCRLRGLAFHTLRNYGTSLKAFQKWPRAYSIDTITVPTIRAYLTEMQGRGYSYGSLHQAYRVIRRLLRWLVAEGVIERNPIERLKLPRPKGDVLEPIALDDVKAMLGTCSGEGFLDVRDRAILLNSSQGENRMVDHVMSAGLTLAEAQSAVMPECFCRASRLTVDARRW